MAASDGFRRAVAIIKIILNIIVGLALSIAMIVMGVIYKDDCPRQYLIPIYLIVLGCTVFVMSVFCILYLCVVSKKAVVMVAIVISVILALFNVAWLIAGGIWIFGIYNAEDHIKKCPDELRDYWMNFTNSTIQPMNSTATFTATASTMGYTNSTATTMMMDKSLYWMFQENYCCPAIYIFAFVVTIVLYVFMVLTLLYEIYNMLLTAYRASAGKIRNKNNVVLRTNI